MFKTLSTPRVLRFRLGDGCSMFQSRPVGVSKFPRKHTLRFTREPLENLSVRRLAKQYLNQTLTPHTRPSIPKLTCRRGARIGRDSEKRVGRAQAHHDVTAFWALLAIMVSAKATGRHYPHTRQGVTVVPASGHDEAVPREAEP